MCGPPTPHAGRRWWFTARRQNRRWLREQKLTAGIGFNTAVVQLLDHLKETQLGDDGPGADELANQMQEAARPPTRSVPATPPISPISPTLSRVGSGALWRATALRFDDVPQIGLRVGEVAAPVIHDAELPPDDPS